MRFERRPTRTATHTSEIQALPPLFAGFPAPAGGHGAGDGSSASPSPPPLVSFARQPWFRSWHSGAVQVSAKMDYAVRAMIELTATSDARLNRDTIAERQAIPARYLEEILSRLRQAGLVTAVRGASGGFTLARPANEITVADIWRAVDGPLTLVQGQRPESVSHGPPAQHLQSLWVALRASVRSVMETVTLAHLVEGDLPPTVREHLSGTDAWVPR